MLLSKAPILAGIILN